MKTCITHFIKKKLSTPIEKIGSQNLFAMKRVCYDNDAVKVVL